MKKVPFNLEQWQANGSKVEDLEYRSGEGVRAIAISSDLTLDYPVVTWGRDCDDVILCNTNGRYICDSENKGNDLFMYVPTPTEIKSGEWVAKKATDTSWAMYKGNVNKCNYHTHSNSLCFYGNVINTDDLQTITDIITQINAL